MNVVRIQGETAYSYDTDALASDSRSGTVEEILNQLTSIDVLLIDGALVSTPTINLPNIPRKQQLSAAQFGLEEQITGSIDEQHFALGEQHDNQLAVAVIDRTVMDALYQRLVQHGVLCEKIIPDYFALPVSKHWIVFYDTTSNKFLIRVDRDDGFTCSTENVFDFLQLRIQETAEIPESIKLYNCPESLVIDWEALGIPVSMHTAEFSNVMRQGIHDETTINLLQNDYPALVERKGIPKAGLLIAGILGVWFGLSLLVNAVTYYQLSAKNTALTAEIATVYRSVYPNAKRVVSPKARMQRDLRRAGSGDAGQFLQYIKAIAPIIKQRPVVKVVDVSYAKNAVVLNLTLDSFQSLDELQKALSATRYRIKRENAATKDGQVTARLKVSQAR